MESKVVEEKENPLFKRKEVKMIVTAEVTPSHSEIIKLISEKLSANIEGIKVKKIHGKFGSKDFIVTANIYQSKEDKDNIELKTKKEIEAEKAAEEERKKAEEETAKAQEEKSNMDEAEGKKDSGEEIKEETQ